jgi:hypothetical protein
MAREVLIEGQRLKQKRNNMNKTLLTILTGAALSFAVQQADAAQITGTIRMDGAVTLDTQDLATANSATFSNPAASVSSGTGSYTGVTTGTAVNWKNFSWNPASTPVDDLWSFSFGGKDYTFDLQTITSVNRIDSSDLIIKGLGTVGITGFDSTTANWSFSITDTSEGKSGSFTFGFSDSNTAVATPDGGATAMLLGAGFLGLAGLRRKLS